MTMEVADGAHGFKLGFEGRDQPIFDLFGGIYFVDDCSLLIDYGFVPEGLGHFQ